VQGPKKVFAKNVMLVVCAIVAPGRRCQWSVKAYHLVAGHHVAGRLGGGARDLGAPTT
jgi:hypothetical protein